jgi:6,7-dimethyl-8-ribityllumazine synthase
MVNILAPAASLDPQTRIAIVVSRFNQALTAEMLRGATATLVEQGIDEGRIDVAWVPGAWEIPLALEQLSRTRRYGALLALGVVIRGETTHDRQINRFVSLSIGELSLKYNVPIGMGLLTCNDMKQAVRRADPARRNKGGEAARAALDMLRLCATIKD